MASAASSTHTAISSRSAFDGLRQHVVGAAVGPARRLADPDADADEVGGVEVVADRSEAVVAGQPAADLDPDATRREVELVVDRRPAGAGSSMPYRRHSGATAWPDSFM